ncbi:fatty acid cis/trans isomerase [Teredinibacter franksiae]|uniref:fatty acid cis/trans isomerase n=1 Tax=Teredinibacter franksiae TaxID=2761453 RepID=UPI00162A8073|nr:fatty acid cis/trans isomerase [Teredinibacter franksiae]
MTPALKRLLISSLFLLIVGCTSLTVSKFTQQFGEATPKSRAVEQLPENGIDYWTEVKPILEKRCVVCHACYDAPCQLKLTAPEGAERGASKARVYHPERITAAPLTRLFEDATTVEGWRENGFYPVLNEHQNTLAANQQASVLHQILTLKKRQPLPEGDILPQAFTLGINRQQSCPNAEEFEKFSANQPYWGMPYALPALNDQEQQVLLEWVEQGATYTVTADLEIIFLDEIKKWENFLNKNSLERQLSARYIYEHLFLAHIYFDELDQRRFFKLVRSRTPSGQPVERINTRRPFDDPGTARVYYRIIPEQETIVAKTHMPYALHEDRLTRWSEYFDETAFEVQALPDYSRKHASNPFLAFHSLPMKSRYKFMLDEAQFSIMNFIKGPVCRGQSALNVINDHFWVFFIDPEHSADEATAEFMHTYAEDFELPSARGDINMPLTNWLRYSRKQRRLLAARDAYLEEFLQKNPDKIGLDIVWDGNNSNKNAALTIFRNFDSATVEKGLIGAPPKSAWIIGYPLLERIHYLLVAGYDVYGNVGHQLLSRLYMDFLRMEGESNFLMLLPSETRQQERENWYKDASPKVFEYLTHPSIDKKVEPNILYQTDNHKLELYRLLQSHLTGALSQQRLLSTLKDENVRVQLEKLATFKGAMTTLLSEHSHLLITDRNTGANTHISLIKNNAHKNITSMFGEGRNLDPQENTVSVTNGFIGAYPLTFFQLSKTDLPEFVQRVLALESEQQYTKLMADFGIRRTDPEFWQHSDNIHNALLESAGAEFGVLDYNRLENR